ncbi:MAG: rod shape-determining protein RodA [Actinobacteria bacterium]|nr:rod shape-determining protein RodA [Actinomycetota bacterium]
MLPGIEVEPEAGRRVDWILVAAALALCALGTVLVWSVTRNLDGVDASRSYLKRNLLNVGIGCLLALVAWRLDARQLRLIGPVVYVLSLLGLLAVFVVGTTVNGAHAWIRIGGGFAVQPAEFMKLGLIVGMSVMFAARAMDRDDDQRPTTSDVLIALALLAVPLGLIMLQPDLGSAIVLCAAALGVLLAGGVPARWLVGLIAFGALGAVLAVKAGLLAEYQLDRFRAFANPNIDTQGVAYNVNQARIAIAGGHLFGTGLFHGAATNGGYVPEQQTDFIFSAAGEQLGFVGGGAIIALFAVICWRGLRIAAQSDRIGRLIACGVVCWMAFQAFQNIGMNLGLTPVTGLPLPFVSYGGSSMFAQSLAIGLLLAVRRASPR